MARTRDDLHSCIGDEVDELARKFGWRDEVLVADENECRHVDVLRALALIGEPHGSGSDAISGWIDPRHRLDHLPADSRDRRLCEQYVHARFGGSSQVAARSDAPLVNGAAIR